jgi:hypothetical protein
MSAPTPEELGRDFAKIMAHRDANGGKHLHHRNCIHNLPPEEQVALRGKSVEWWTTVVGPMPVQITPDEWECEPPL